MSGQPRVNQSSIRYSDEVLKIINSAKGNTFGDKFESIALDYLEIKEIKEKNIKNLDRQISDKQKYLNEISQNIFRYRDILSDLESLFNNLSECNTNKKAAV